MVGSRSRARTLCPREGRLQVWRSEWPDIAAEIPAIKELDSDELRAAVVATWTAGDGQLALRLARRRPAEPAPADDPRARCSCTSTRSTTSRCTSSTWPSPASSLPVDRDAALATAILHDVDKPMIYRRGDGPGLDYAPGTQLSDHGAIGADARG